MMDDDQFNKQQMPSHEASRDEYWQFDEKNPFKDVLVKKRTMQWTLTISAFAIVGPLLALLVWKAIEQGLHPLHTLGGVAFFTFVLVYRWYTKVWRV